MEENVISAKTTDIKEDVIQVFEKYDMLALPVVDTEDRLIGMITVDDIIDVIQEEYTVDIEKKNKKGLENQACLLFIFFVVF